LQGKTLTKLFVILQKIGGHKIDSENNLIVSLYYFIFQILGSTKFTIKKEKQI